MCKAFYLVIFFLSLKTFVSSQTKGPLTVAIICNDNYVNKFKQIPFILEFVNHTSDTLAIPDKIAISPGRKIGANMAFEILRIYNKDTSDVLKTHNEDINFGPLFKNEYKLEPFGKRLIKIDISDFFFDEMGTYMIRFVLMKKPLYGPKFYGDVYSNWKIIDQN